MPTLAPDALPVLGAGAHRRARDGACFMEWVSLLAGERWGDHPRCTHPLLAHLARMVNDVVADDQRQLLLPLVPAVIGLVSRDQRWDLELAHLVAVRAAPLAGPGTLRPLVAGVLTTDRALVRFDGRTPGAVRPATARLLAEVPADAAWAERFVASVGLPRTGLADLSRAVLDSGVAVLAAGGATGRAATERDARLVVLLGDAVAVLAGLAGRPTAVTPPGTVPVGPVPMGVAAPVVAGAAA